MFFCFPFFKFQSNPSTPTVKSPTKLPQFFSPGMLPPPPPPPPNLARPVAILKTSDGQTVVGSNASSVTSSANSKSFYFLILYFFFFAVIHLLSCHKFTQKNTVHIFWYYVHSHFWFNILTSTIYNHLQLSRIYAAMLIKCKCMAHKDVWP